LQFWGMVNMLAIPKFFRQKNPQYEMPVWIRENPIAGRTNVDFLIMCGAVRFAFERFGHGETSNRLEFAWV
jgi:hypothetical protein